MDREPGAGTAWIVVNLFLLLITGAAALLGALPAVPLPIAAMFWVWWLTKQQGER